MSGMARAMVLGNLGGDPEVKFLGTGTQLATFRVAASKRWTDKQGQKQERVTWVRVSTFGKLADVCGQYLKKGSQVWVDGDLEVRSYEDKQGQKREMTEIVARDVQFLSRKEVTGRPLDDMGYDDVGSDESPF